MSEPVTIEDWEAYAAEITASLFPQPACIVRLDDSGRIVGRLTVQKEVRETYVGWVDVEEHDRNATHMVNGQQITRPQTLTAVQQYIQALPDINEQLDAIWTHLAKSRNSLPAATRTMLERVEAARAKKPKGGI